MFLRLSDEAIVTEHSEALWNDVRQLGDALGQTMAAHMGQSFLDKVESIRTLAKQGRLGDQSAREELATLLQALMVTSWFRSRVPLPSF